MIPKGPDGKDRAKFVHQGSGYNVLVQWANKERSWIPLSNIASTCPAECAKYASENKLLEEVGWKQFAKLARRQKLMIRLVKQTHRSELRTAPIYQFGVRVPRNHDEAVEFDVQDQRHQSTDGSHTCSYSILYSMEASSFARW